MTSTLRKHIILGVEPQTIKKIFTFGPLIPPDQGMVGFGQNNNFISFVF